MRIIIIIFLILLPIYLTSDSIHEYEQYRIHSFEIGSSEGKIGYNPKRYPAGVAGPTAFTISQKFKYYICDPNNRCIQIYDRNFTFIDSIKDIQSGYTSSGFKIVIDEFKNVLVLGGEKDLIKFDSNGDLNFFMMYSKLSNDVTGGHNFFTYHDKVLYYDNNMDIKFLDPQGNILNKETTDKEIAVMKKNISNISENDTFNVTGSLINKFLNKKMIGFKDDVLLTARIKTHREYFEMLKSELNTTSIIAIEDKFDITSIGVKIDSLDFISFDNDGNSYWAVYLSMKPEDRAVLVCSRYGEALDCFYNRVKWSKIAIAPDGDVYFLDFDDKGTHLYKTTRRW